MSGRLSQAVRLDGRIDSVVKEITRLHGEIEEARGEILAVFKLTLPKAIRIGQLLTRIRASRRGKWLVWIADHLPFSQRSAYNYISLYERRESLQHLQTPTLNNAYKALLPPTTRRATPEQESTVVTVPSGVFETSNGADSTQPDDPQLASPPESGPPQPQRRHKSQRQIMKELQRISEHERAAEMEANERLTGIIATLNKKIRAQWSKLPAHLELHGQQLLNLAKRLQLNTP